MGAVSRLTGFIENVKSENLPGEDIIPPAEWSEKGDVTVKGVLASYGWVHWDT
jgi:ATP-binding cassette, subfamily C (CFTR/MRP), member 1